MNWENQALYSKLIKAVYAVSKEKLISHHSKRKVPGGLLFPINVQLAYIFGINLLNENLSTIISKLLLFLTQDKLAHLDATS